MLNEKQIEMVLATERYIWKNPEPGFREVKTTAYLLHLFRKLGYDPVVPEDITGFYADLDTGRPGPCVAVMGEMDSLIVPAHPDADPETGAVHACGHHVQCAMLVGAAAAMKNEGALDGLCGKIRFMAVPAEELIELDFRENLRRAGTIGHYGGKMEFMRRGYFDGVDMAFMFHTGVMEAGTLLYLEKGNIGCVLKQAEFRGRSTHAAASPEEGINALYAATNAINAINSIRETFTDGGQVRCHPILTEGGTAVNAIPDRAVLENQVRGNRPEVILEYNRRVNLACAAAAASVGASLHILDRPGYFPLNNDPGLSEVLAQAMEATAGPGSVIRSTNRSTGSTDVGDLSTMMPVAMPLTFGAQGRGHSDDYRIPDPHQACIPGAECMAKGLQMLLEQDAVRAKQILAAYTPMFSGYDEYVRTAEEFNLDLEAVTYEKDGTVTLRYQKENRK